MTLNWWYPGCRQGQPITLVCGCTVATPAGLGRGAPRHRRVKALQKRRCRNCAENHIRTQAAALTDPDGNPLSKKDVQAFVDHWLPRIATRPLPISEGATLSGR